jgi:lipopolysaccharide biosynthesis protein
MRRIKQEIFLFIAWWVKFFGLRNEAWYQEHLSRVKHSRNYLSNQKFDYEAYGRIMLENSKNPAKNDFVPLAKDSYQRKESDPKVIAFYLPQFHQIPENNEWHGKGFTEWTNVTKAVPQFLGHHQPQLPIDVGFYDLASPKVMYRQVELAKQYGLYGFCFHYYWFSGGKRLLETPIFNWLNNKDLDFPFCLCWANENWSKLWDGGNREVLLKQESKAEDAEDFFRDILPFLQDERYIRMEGKPMLTIYRPNLFEKEEMLKFSVKLRELAIKAGLPGLWLNMVGVDYFEGTASEWGFDGLVEFPPMRITHLRKYVTDGNPINPDFKGFVYTMEESIESGAIFENKVTDVPVFRGCFPRWDNTARKAYSNASTYLQSPETFRKWLSGLLKWTKENNSPEKQLIFINAWNEWAEGAQLEPDSRYGYAYLQSVKDAIEHE